MFSLIAEQPFPGADIGAREEAGCLIGVGGLKFFGLRTAFNVDYQKRAFHVLACIIGEGAAEFDHAGFAPIGEVCIAIGEAQIFAAGFVDAGEGKELGDPTLT